jgi:hypothetical protein
MGIARKQFCASMLAVFTALAPSSAYSNEMCRRVGSEWVWFSDHVAFSVDYYVIGRGDRSFEVGTGMSVNGSVWGSTQIAKRSLQVTAYGAGAIHVRKADQGEDFDICVGATKLEVIDLCGKNWLGYNDCPTF